MENGTTLLEVENLTKRFSNRGGLFFGKKDEITAVNDVSFSINPREVMGLVGESGCGKTTLGRLIVRLCEKDDGTIRFKGQDIHQWDAETLRQKRKEIQMIFQDPYSALNPRVKILDTITEAIKLHHPELQTDTTRRDRAEELLQEVGLDVSLTNRYPDQLSGGQRRRVGIARVLAVEPEFVVADEPVSKLDVSLQGQIIELMQELRAKKDLTYLYISHDLKLVQHISDKLAVMYLGKIVELASRDVIQREAYQHPYTQLLMASILTLHAPTQKMPTRRIRGIQSQNRPVDGCPFQPRCPLYKQKGEPIECRQSTPPLVPLDKGHSVACHFVD